MRDRDARVNKIDHIGFAMRGCAMLELIEEEIEGISSCENLP